MSVKVLCLSLWPAGTAPALRFRCEAFFPPLAARGIDVSQASFFTAEEYASVKYARNLKSIWPIVCGFARRLAALIELHRYDVIWLLREAAPVGPPVLEEIIVRLFRKSVVFDFDDAVWLDQGESFPARLLRCRSKTAKIIQVSSHVVAGNAFLADFALSYNRNTSLIPTCVDTTARFSELHDHEHGHRPIVGWTGSHSTTPYLETLNSVLTAGQRRREYDVAVISDRAPTLTCEFDFFQWTSEAEVTELRRFDIGVMPLGNSAWELGKCGFKLIQYMALGIPPLASGVGANNEIVRHGIDGLLCRTEAEWVAGLRTLSSDAAMRREMGLSGRERVEAHYSTASQVGRIAAILLQAAGKSDTSISPEASKMGSAVQPP